MNYTALKAAMNIALMRLPVTELSLCHGCGEFYKSSYTFYCRESQGMESDEAQCPTWECVEAREVGK